jgi:hypothetical protein
MTEIDDELMGHGKVLRGRAREAEELWRAARGLNKGLHGKGNAKARERRRRTECPKEPKANVAHRRYRDKQFGKMGAASKARRIEAAPGREDVTRQNLARIIWKQERKPI